MSQLQLASGACRRSDAPKQHVFGVPDVDHNDIVQTLGWALQDPHMLPVNAIMAILCTLGLPNLLVPVFSWPTTSVLAMISSNVRLWIHTEEFGRGKCSEKAV